MQGRTDMTPFPRLAFGTVLLFVVGCVALNEPEKLPTVSGHFNDSPPPQTVAKSPLPAAEETVSVRVDFVGRKVLAANPQIGMRPTFMTVKSPTPEIFHVDQRMIYITDGLVKQLPSEADLAAALSFEFGRMVAEREARVRQDLKFNSARPPIQLPIGGPGSLAATDMASTVEMAKYDKARRELQQIPAKLNPETLARNYLEQAGFGRTDIDRIQPQLQAAEKNCTLERQTKGTVAPNAWVK